MEETKQQALAANIQAAKRLDPERIALVKECVKLGVPKAHIAKKLGVHRSTLRGWRRRGESFLAEKAVPKTKLDFLTIDLARAMEEAEGNVIYELLELIHQHAKKDLKAAVWLAERLAPEEFGKFAIPTGSQPDQIQFKVVHTREELAEGVTTTTVYEGAAPAKEERPAIDDLPVLDIEVESNLGKNEMSEDDYEKLS